MENYSKMFCSFCGKSSTEAGKLVASPSGTSFICDECISICKEILKEDEMVKFEGKVNLLTPEQIKAKLDDYIIDQEKAKKVLSVAVYNHYKRINYNLENKISLKNKNIVELEKSNVLLLGPTGCGKTLLASTLAKILEVPFVAADATTLTEAGYVGEDVESILLKLIQAADYDIKRAERGIVYIDEIDKIAKKSQNKALPRDPSGEGVQQALLKIIEGTTASVPPQGGRKFPYQENLSIDTTNILFICGGAFVGIDKIIESRINLNKLGFNISDPTTSEIKAEEEVKKVKPEDLNKFGLIPEFVGRMPIIVAVNELSETALVKILKEPKNAITKQYKQMFNLEGINLEFDDSALVEVAKKAITLKSGARGLRTILEDSMLELMYKTPSNKNIKTIVLDESFINETGEPHVLYSDKVPINA
ncbi:MAG: ATP-dependent Clp protease ATP-binding subunit ClpX [Clostridia bacterium]|nr:ATP-dependent Clp protease ATP-binding subunit ClpX [Clostridia bacterium]